MKNLLTKLTFTAVLVTGLAAVGAAQGRLGGYKSASVEDERVTAAADFAVKAEAEKSKKSQKLISIMKAEQQVVAGTNFKLCLKVISGGNGDEADVTHTIEAIVYVDLKGNSSLTSWKESDCSDDDTD